MTDDSVTSNVEAKNDGGIRLKLNLGYILVIGEHRVHFSMKLTIMLKSESLLKMYLVSSGS